MNRFGWIALPLCAIQTAAIAADTREFALDGGVTLQVVEKPFVASKHRITYCKTDESDTQCPCKVDGRWAYGTVPCRLPDSRLEKLVVIVSGKTYRLDTSSMYNAFEDRGIEFGGRKLFTVKCKATQCVIRGAFSDGAGSYVAQWRIKNGKTKRIVLSGDEGVMYPLIEAMQKP